MIQACEQSSARRATGPDLHARVPLANSAGVGGVVAGTGQPAELRGGDQRPVPLRCRIEVMAADRRDEPSQRAVQRLWVRSVAGRVHLGLSRGRISQLLAGGPPPERLLWDDDITVAIGGKLEAGKAQPGRVVALEDFGTFTELCMLLQGLQLDATHEAIPASDPEGRRWPRYKPSDDATIAYLTASHA